MAYSKVVNTMEQNQKENKVRRFEILNGRSNGRTTVSCCQLEILKGVVKVSLIKVKFEQRFEELKKLVKQVAKGRIFPAETTSRAKAPR